MHALKLGTLNESDYLAFENASPERHGYVAGEIFAMSGANLQHAAVTGNIL